MLMFSRLSRVSRRVVIPLTAFSLANCVGLPRNEPPGQGPLRLQPEEVEKRIVGERPEWGLALSGGGLRSALFSIGVMKSLHDTRHLGRFGIISAVSGGSYAAYWLYTNERGNTAAGSLFGEQSFSSSNFNARACQLMINGNFVKFGSMIRRGITSASAVRLYDERIARTFGSSDTDPAARISDMTAAGFRGSAPPYLIVNSTLIRPKPKGWRTGLYESTPLLSGNAAYSYLRWTDESPKLRQVVSVSGAAVQPLLKQRIKSPNPELERLRPEATDGGTSENLGAIALIRRGVRNVVIVDAEHDPKLRYPAYVNLRRRLASYDSEISIRTLDAETAPGSKNETEGPALHTGFVRSRGRDGSVVTTNVYYLKMRISPALRSRFAESPVLAEGRRFDEDFTSLWKQKLGPDCTRVRSSAPIPRSLFLYNVAGYSRFLNEHSAVRFSKHLPPFFHGSFPHYLTPDQSYYTDQVLAFVGLGYLQAEELAAAIAKGTVKPNAPAGDRGPAG
jgi:hypothetical protein